jgi:hypothetical protein
MFFSIIIRQSRLSIISYIISRFETFHIWFFAVKFFSICTFSNLFQDGKVDVHTLQMQISCTENSSIIVSNVFVSHYFFLSNCHSFDKDCKAESKSVHSYINEARVINQAIRRFINSLLIHTHFGNFYSLFYIGSSLRLIRILIQSQIM